MRMTSSSTRRGTRCLAEALNRALRMVFAFLLVLAPFAAHAVSESDLLSPRDAFPLKVSLSGPQQVTLDFGTKPGYYLYRDRFSFAVDGVPVKPAGMPASESKNDPTFGVVQVYHRPVQLQLPLPHVIASGIVLSVTSQGCADLGVCYPPLTRTYRIAADGTVTAIVQDGTATATTGPGETTVAVENRTLSVFGLNLRPANGLGVSELLGFLLAGLLMAGTMCMYPLIPIVTRIVVGGESAGKPWRGFVLTLAYVQGLALTYAFAGTVAALLGIQLVLLTQMPWVLAGFGLLMVVFALGMFGVFRLQLPGNWQTMVAGWSGRLPGGRLFPAFLMGALSALIVGPCSTPALAGALLYIANSRDVVSGALDLYVMALGLGLPLLLVGTFGARVLPKGGRWMVAVQNALGVMLLVAALWFVYSLLPDWLLMLLVAALLASCGMMLRAFDPLVPDATGIHRVGKALGVLLVAAGIAEMLGAASGNYDMLQPLRGTGTAPPVTSEASVHFEPVRSVAELDEALKAARGQPVMLDFYADWCVTCKELEHYTFADPRVMREFAHWKLLKIDVTKGTTEDVLMLRRYGLFGPPALIFYDRGGERRDEAELVGFVGADAFLTHLKQWDR
ncbi:protein-disulfide reductase DsbD [Paraburkholderia fungorum]|uniref:Protein-disulfide reductase DsbD n=1 Tax=Paraburkholderia fungorum TaxID=134537 RepID=A0AAP5QDB9_9BURK|nr:protein-disulfide reductase DsbD [Paraburkholderia fungorum]MDT8840169.1 protein-disulfide reductase DsbD [Paraburkholderia fungorum]